MSVEIIVPPAVEAHAPTPAPVADALHAAAAIVNQAQTLAELAAPDDSRMHEVIALVSETRDLVRDMREQLVAMGAQLGDIRAAQIVDEIIEVIETPPAVVEEEAPVHVEVNAPSDGAVVEKETVVADNPPVAEKRAEQKPARRWL